MSPSRITFSGVPVDRLSIMRGDARALETALDSARARVLPVWRTRCLVARGRAVRLSTDEFERDPNNPPIFLGRQEDTYLFAAPLPEQASPSGSLPGEFMGLRELASRVPEGDAALLAYARAMVIWQTTHRFCGVCGHPNRPKEGGFVMACTREGCGHRSFPRLDPAVIVLVHQKNACLLGRKQEWPEPFYSTIAGFVEPGESLEDAVRREIAEETNIRAGNCTYIGSQPWPFPAALMLGFHALADSTEIRCNDRELADARWFTRDELAAGAVRLPPRESIAWRLIQAWFDAEAGRRLASLDWHRPMAPPPGGSKSRES